MKDNRSYIKVVNLNKTIEGNVVLDSINLNLEKGRIYGFRGKNGSGKTMLFRAICGLIKPTEGVIEIDGKELHKEISFPQSVGVLIEYPGLIGNLSALKNLKILAEIKNQINEVDIINTIRRVGLNPDSKLKVKKYSLGMKQRLGIAQAIMENPDLIILDEPTNALDSDGLQLIRDILMELKLQGKTILIACHDKEEIEFLSDETYTLELGRITNHEIIKEN